MPFMTNEVSPARHSRRLGRRHLFRLKMAQAWIALGDFNEASREFRQLPRYAQNHPEATPVREQITRSVTF
jgi:hypothetical protein